MAEWHHSLRIPIVDKPHEVIFAFLRTSEWGEWHPRRGMPGDAFVMHFERGARAFAPNFLGFGSREVTPYVDTSTPMREVLMLLRVTLRPSPSNVAINLYHTACFFTSQGKLPYLQQSIHQHIQGEVCELAGYLRECYGLPEVPAIEGTY